MLKYILCICLGLPFFIIAWCGSILFIGWFYSDKRKRKERNDD